MLYLVVYYETYLILEHHLISANHAYSNQVIWHSYRIPSSILFDFLRSQFPVHPNLLIPALPVHPKWLLSVLFDCYVFQFVLHSRLLSCLDFESECWKHFNETAWNVLSKHESLLFIFFLGSGLTYDVINRSCCYILNKKLLMYTTWWFQKKKWSRQEKLNRSPEPNLIFL